MLLRAEAIAEELLQRSRSSLGCSMREIAGRLGVELHVHDLPAAIAGMAIRERRAILLSPTGYAARDEFTLAHELMELHIPQSWIDEMPRATKEELCDRGAAALLLPKASFRASIDDLGLDLPRLRRRWRNASWATIARRLVDVGVAASIANWESLELAWRYGGEPHHDEELALAEVYAGRGRASVGAVRAWRLGGSGLGRAVSVVQAG